MNNIKTKLKTMRYHIISARTLYPIPTQIIVINLAMIWLIIFPILFHMFWPANWSQLLQVGLFIFMVFVEIQFAMLFGLLVSSLNQMLQQKYRSKFNKIEE